MSAVVAAEMVTAIASVAFQWLLYQLATIMVYIGVAGCCCCCYGSWGDALAAMAASVLLWLL
jgi:hypothetical protein